MTLTDFITKELVAFDEQFHWIESPQFANISDAQEIHIKAFITDAIRRAVEEHAKVMWGKDVEELNVTAILKAHEQFIGGDV